ncbi:DedA family protein [Zhihengliuella sp.]|uniref:DedA family protein n=1 Tax=Zhihengliuella sp. TaxID=1954483 RepID=UPI00281255DE|nr:DedA family protein [Zhihengliuella sp.]
MLLIVFAFCAIDAFFPIVPSESLLVGLASVAVSTGDPDLVLLGVLGALGAVLGDQIAYWLGSRLGTQRFAWMRRPRSQRVLRFARRELDRRGGLLIFTARYIPIGRTAVNFTAGATGYPRGVFSAFDVASCVFWAAYSVTIGALAGQWFEEHKVLAIVVSVAIAIALGYFMDRLIYFVLRRRQEHADAHDAVD